MTVKGQAAGQGPRSFSVKGRGVTFQSNMPLHQLAHNSNSTTEILILKHVPLF